MDKKHNPARAIEIVASITLITVGIGGPFLVPEILWVPAVGTVIATIGATLLTLSLTATREKDKAVEILGPDLQSIARHLSDVASGLTRTLQEIRQGKLSTEVAIDRVSNLTFGLYSSIHDVNLLVGETANFELLSETLDEVQKVTATFERLSTTATKQGIEGDAARILKEQIESLKMQIASAKKSVGETPSRFKDEDVHCPQCKTLNRVSLGTTHGDSALSVCSGCGTRFHIHRGPNGPFTRAWGNSSSQSASLTKAMEVRCPNTECGALIPLNFDISQHRQNRICMDCLSDVAITIDGAATVIGKATKYQTRIVRDLGARQVLLCPKCQAEWPSIWSHDGLVRAVCRHCNAMLEAQYFPQDSFRGTMDAMSALDLLTHAVRQALRQDGWAFLGQVGFEIRRIAPSFDSMDYGFEKLAGLARSFEDQFEFKEVRDPSGPIHVYIRPRTQAPPSSPNEPTSPPAAPTT